MLLFLFLFALPMYFGLVPSFIDEAAPVGEEGAIDGIEDGKLSQSLHGKEQHGTDNHEPDELGRGVSNATTAIPLIEAVTYHTAGPTIGQGLSGTDEETSTDGATCLDMTVGQKRPCDCLYI